MEKIRFRINQMPEASPGLSLALGNFDGFHRGHQDLFVKTSVDASAESGVLIFDSPFGHGPILSSTEDKLRYALHSRLDRAYVFEGGQELYALTPEQFIEQVLLPLGTKRVVVGEDFRFGANRAGGPDTLGRYFQVDIVPLRKEDGQKISSSSIKSLISQGNLEKAASYLGKPYEVCGKVVEGFHNGAKLGFPTVNLQLDANYVLPKSGVYCGVCYVGGIAYRAMVNVGVNPTLGKLTAPIIETHLLDYEGQCYGKTVYCAFLTHIRDEIKFSSLEELKKQLERDEIAVKDTLS